MIFSQKTFLLKCAEIFFLFIVAIGLLEQVEDVVAILFAIVTDWTKIGISFVCLLLVSLGIAYLWQKSQKGEHLHAYFQVIIIFYTVYEISNYGLAKILQTQFQPPQYILDTPIGDLNGFWLTWTYFGHSETFAFILGWTQVLGSLLLLFRYTRLIGVFVLLPVMLNINLINHFYDIAPLAYYNAIHYTFILVFLMLLDYEKLKFTFLSYQEKIRINFKTILLNVARVMLFGASFWYIYSLKSSMQPKTKLNGVWQVQSITRNQNTVLPTENQDSVWSKVYIEWRYGCVFKYHPHLFQDKDLRGSYKIDQSKQLMDIRFPSKDEKSAGDSLQLSYHFENDSIVVMRGIYQHDSLILNLKRLPLKTP